MGFYRDKVFPLLCEVASRQLGAERRALLESAQGQVLEVGFGTGISLTDYPDEISGLVALEPSPGMLKKARKRVGSSSRFSVELVEGVCESLPFSDQAFDSVVSIVTLCSVSDIGASMSEIRRVLRPGGVLLFLEHARQPEPCFIRTVQAGLNEAWGKVTCGCNLTREPLAEMERAGFSVEHLKTLGMGGFPCLVSPIYRGLARL